MKENSGQLELKDNMVQKKRDDGEGGGKKGRNVLGRTAARHGTLQGCVSSLVVDQNRCLFPQQANAQEKQGQTTETESERKAKTWRFKRRRRTMTKAGNRKA